MRALLVAVSVEQWIDRQEAVGGYVLKQLGSG